MPEKTLNQFCLVQFSEAYFHLSPEERHRLHQRFLQSLGDVAERAYVYQVFPSRADADILVWLAVHTLEPSAPAAFFQRVGILMTSMRPYWRPVLSLWGFTKPSVYARGQSPQEMDPFADHRKTYLILYPFVKTAEWYLLSQDTRQGIMNEHIRVGRRYPTILQLLLYSFGLQDQEFVVVYETDDLMAFSDLVYDLRATEARRYTERDTPIVTAFYRPAEATLALFETAP